MLMLIVNFGRIFDSNSFSGPIPDTIGFAQKLQTLQLDNNKLSGNIPININSLSGLCVLDLSNNSFTPSTAPSWFSTLTSLNSLAMENTQLTGQIPGGLFALDQIKQVLVNNPLCQSAKYSNNLYCQSQQKHLPPYSTSLANCKSASCTGTQKLNPRSCTCAYPFSGSGSSSSISKAAVAGIAVGGCIILIAIALLTVYGLKQRRKVREAAAIASPFASWGSSGKDNGTAPQLKGIRCFTFEELKKCSGYFSENNEIGEGGYGKVYKGYLTDGVAVAIK
ncbi:Leucine-rich repeat protein kinase family protein [Rhynchospora pubera]|uniref:Leucine-rich repeat protein kinase family protein n=1 Tax=Rhynchospora pubera TaxID=906938 RepID=A0AAV8DQP5_9POAL|nr:Leucine-rich repeat protein kinase family protein [Rhynchospora pubera]